MRWSAAEYDNGSAVYIERIIAWTSHRFAFDHHSPLGIVSALDYFLQRGAVPVADISPPKDLQDVRWAFASVKAQSKHCASLLTTEIALLPVQFWGFTHADSRVSPASNANFG